MYVCYETVSHSKRSEGRIPIYMIYSKHIPRIPKLSIFIITRLQSLGKIIPYAIFAQKRALPSVTKIILIEKLFPEYETQILDLFIWIIGQHTKKIEQDPRTKCVGHHLI